MGNAVHLTASTKQLVRPRRRIFNAAKMEASETRCLHGGGLLVAGCPGLLIVRMPDSVSLHVWLDSRLVRQLADNNLMMTPCSVHCHLYRFSAFSSTLRQSALSVFSCYII